MQIGSDIAGKPGRTSEEIGSRAAENLLEDINSGATVDRFTPDQLILYASLADGESEYMIPPISEHIDFSLWLVEEILGAKVSLKDRNIKMKGIGL